MSNKKSWTSNNRFWHFSNIICGCAITVIRHFAFSAHSTTSTSSHQVTGYRMKWDYWPLLFPLYVSKMADWTPRSKRARKLQRDTETRKIATYFQRFLKSHKMNHQRISITFTTTSDTVFVNHFSTSWYWCNRRQWRSDAASLRTRLIDFPPFWKGRSLALRPGDKPPLC